MKIAAIQKLTLLDYPGRVACTVFLPGCNLRCPFCHNADLVWPERFPSQGITPEELENFLRCRRRKLDGVCITGGEPTVWQDLPELIGRIRNLGFLVKLDTNGSHPAMLRKLLEENLIDYVAMDIKNSPGRYRETCGGVDILEKVRESADILMEGDTEYEFRTTVCNLHTPEDMAQIGVWLRGARQYFLQPFVDSGNLVGQGVRALETKEIEALREAMLADIPVTRIRGI